MVQLYFARVVLSIYGGLGGLLLLLLFGGGGDKG